MAQDKAEGLTIVLRAPAPLALPPPIDSKDVKANAIVLTGEYEGGIAVTITNKAMTPALVGVKRFAGHVLLPDGSVVDSVTPVDTYLANPHLVKQYGDLIRKHAVARELDQALTALGATRVPSAEVGYVTWTTHDLSKEYVHQASVDLAKVEAI